MVGEATMLAHWAQTVGSNFSPCSIGLAANDYQPLQRPGRAIGPLSVCLPEPMTTLE